MKRENEIVEELKEMGSMLADMPRIMPYSVPEGYFSRLTDGALNLVQQADEQTLFWSRSMPHEVPQGYFDDLPAHILAAVQVEKKPARTISVFSVSRWAAAAVMALVISVGSYITFSGGGANESERILSSVPKTEINEYLDHRYGVDVRDAMQQLDIKELKVDNKEIVEYLNETGWD